MRQGDPAVWSAAQLLSEAPVTASPDKPDRGGLSGL